MKQEKKPVPWWPFGDLGPELISNEHEHSEKDNWLFNPAPPVVEEIGHSWDEVVNGWQEPENVFGRGDFAPVVERGVYEMEYNRFDMEQDLLACWHVTDDLDLLTEGVLEHDLTTDQVANITIGLKDLYNIRFNKVWDHFERSIKADHAISEFDRVVCQGLDETAEEFAQMKDLVRELLAIDNTPRISAQGFARRMEVVEELTSILGDSDL